MTQAPHQAPTPAPAQAATAAPTPAAQTKATSVDVPGLLNKWQLIAVSACVLFAVVTVAANLMADLLYAALDPRIRYGSR